MITQTSTRQIEPDITVMEVSGRLNLGNTLMGVEDLLRKLIREGSRKLIIDLKGLNYIDSSGIGMIVFCTGEMNEAGGQIRVAGAQGVVAHAFEVVRLSKVVPQDPDVETACHDIRQWRRGVMSRAAIQFNQILGQDEICFWQGMALH